MSKNSTNEKQMTNFFGDENVIPEAIDVAPDLSNLTRPNFSNTAAEEAIIDEDEKKGSGEDMFSSDLEDMVKSVEDSANGVGGDDIEVPNSFLVELDELGADTIVDLWEELRISGHKQIYNWAIYKSPKNAKKVARELSLKQNKSPEEIELLEKIWAYIDKHDEVRSGYMDSVPYNENHKKLIVRVVDAQLKKMKMQGKKVPIWLLWTYLLLIPEVKMAIKMNGLRDDLPTFDFDLTKIRKK
jgi:hypothetical protein